MKYKRLLLTICSILTLSSSEKELCPGEFQESKDIDFSFPDLITSYKANGHEIQLEGFKYFKNSENITVDNFGKQKWFSIGKPSFIETKIKGNEVVFHESAYGFYANIEMLTDEQKILLVKSASNKFKSNFTSDHIKNLKLSCFKCVINLLNEDGSSMSDVYGEVKSFDQYPFRINLKMNEAEKTKFKKLLTANDSLEFDCDLKSKGFFAKTVLHTDKNLLQKFNDKFDCNNGGLWSCINDGKCNETGKCDCRPGFIGDNCAYCIKL